VGGASQGTCVSLSADGHTAIVGGQIETWVWIINGGVWTEQAKLAGSGYSVSLSADGNTAILSTSSGAVVWTRSGEVWVEAASLVESDDIESGHDVQDFVVSLSADGNTALVGWRQERIARIWTRAGAVWSQQVKLDFPVSSVALSADGNTAIIGELYTSGGAAWVWIRAGGVWEAAGPPLIGSGAVGNAYQGSSVCLSADGNTAIVGGSGDNANVGAAWVWTRIGGTWTQQGPKLVGLASIGTSQQGASVSLSEDGDTAIIGGNADQSTAGAAWVWTRSGNLWVQQGPKLVGTPASGSAFQGNSVSIAADGHVAIVGGPDDNEVGAAWVWERTGAVWAKQAKLVGSDAAGVAEQGSSVSVSGDGSIAIVGGQLDNSGVGAAWVWTRSGGGWNQQAKLVGSGTTGAGNRIAVSMSADGNTAIIGRPGDNGGVGAVWVWVRKAGVWTQQGTKLISSDAAGNSRQGGSVALSANGNTAIVGGAADDSYAGAAWVWTRSGEEWTQQGPKLVASGAVPQTSMYGAGQGGSVSISADGNTALVGAAGDNNGAGSAWVWTRIGGVWTQQGSKLVASDAGGHDTYTGTSVSLSGDGNTAIIGGWQYSPDNGRTVTGAAWVWTRNGGVWSQQGPRLISSGTSYSYQGISVSVSTDGNVAVVGDYIDGYAGIGAVRVWRRVGGVWEQQGAKLVGNGATGSAHQGFSVSLSADGKTVITGGPLDNNFAGAGWVFVLEGPRRRAVKHG
jgi:hypothetical protein